MKKIRIPHKLKSAQYYVASSMSYAFSKWDRLQDAQAAVGRFVLFNPLEFKHECIGIIEVDAQGKMLVFPNRLKEY